MKDRAIPATRTGRWGKLTLSKRNKEIPLSTYLHTYNTCSLSILREIDRERLREKQAETEKDEREREREREQGEREGSMLHKINLYNHVLREAPHKPNESGKHSNEF